MYVAFNIALATNGGVQTKGSTVTSGDVEVAGDNEGAVNCFVAAVDDAGNVLASRFYDTESLLTADMIIKVPAKNLPKLTFVAVANLYPKSADVANFLKAKTLTEIQNVPLTASYLNILAKYGTCEVADYNVSSSVIGIESTSIEIPVTQRTARVQLANFIVNGEVAIVNSLTLLNTKMQGKIIGEYNGENPYGSANVASMNELIDGKPRYASYKDIKLYSYENTPAVMDNNYNATALQIAYMDGAKERTIDFTIKTPTANGEWAEKVLANHIYKLSITITKATVKVEINCSTKDWKEGGEIIIDITD